MIMIYWALCVELMLSLVIICLYLRPLRCLIHHRVRRISSKVHQTVLHHLCLLRYWIRFVYSCLITCLIFARWWLQITTLWFLIHLILIQHKLCNHGRHLLLLFLRFAHRLVLCVNAIHTTFVCAEFDELSWLIVLRLVTTSLFGCLQTIPVAT